MNNAKVLYYHYIVVDNVINALKDTSILCTYIIINYSDKKDMQRSKGHL